MKLSTGKVAFPLEFDNGDVEQIMINPHDAKLQERIKGFEKAIQKRMNSIDLEKYKDAFTKNTNMSDITFDNLMKMSAEELDKIYSDANTLSELDKEIEKEFCEELDLVFDSDISSKAFKYVPPLAMVESEEGEPEIYILLVLKALALEIQKYGNKANARTNKYTEKYPKNK